MVTGPADLLMRSRPAPTDKLLLKLRRRDDLSAEEEDAVRALAGPSQSYPARACIVREGEPMDRSALLVEGFIGRNKALRDGERQITELHIPGDFADLHSFTLKRLDHDIIAISDCRISWVSHEALRNVIEGFPHLGRLFWFSTNLDAAIHRAWTVSLGRRDALERLAHLLCELRVRLEIVGMADATGYLLPLTQHDLADCLGLTAVHVNRVIKQLRELGLATVRSGRVSIADLASLQRLAEFSPDYLFLERRSS